MYSKMFELLSFDFVCLFELCIFALFCGQTDYFVKTFINLNYYVYHERKIDIWKDRKIYKWLDR